MAQVLSPSGTRVPVKRARQLVEELEPLERMTADELVDARYERFRRMGKDALC